MKYLVLLIACLPVLSCNTSHPILSPSSLPQQYIAVNTEKDTVVTLQFGTRLTIAAHTFSAKNNVAKIVIKEAITLDQMLRGGLVTKSGNHVLQSGGMIQIMPANGEDVKIVKPFNIEIPTPQVREGMQLYKGVEKDDRVDWVNPVPLDTPVSPLVEPQVVQGAVLYQQNCAVCHGIDKKLTGPPLYGSMERWAHDTASLYRFTRNASKVIAAGDAYATCLFTGYNKAAMTSFDSLSNEEIKAIYRYIDEKGKAIYGTAIPNAFLRKSDCDKCDEYMQAYQQIFTDTTQPKQAISSKEMKQAYRFHVIDFAWYNVDVQLPLENAPPIFVNLHPNPPGTKLYIAIPQHNILIDGQEENGAFKLYANMPSGVVDFKNGTLAYVIAVAGNQPTSLQLAFQSFTLLQSDNNLTLELKPATDHDLQACFETVKHSGFTQHHFQTYFEKLKKSNRDSLETAIKDLRVKLERCGQITDALRPGTL
ncbi:cbb3-type cytochrome c oxidase subunit III [Chitinophaga skermanii]|uniref:Cbb3-type cytochrome c oxidase subunit III n=1 Tax=Chitinophaga skermanii TaxID=331697 RepID=A0A327QN85_9BACT|nr:cytochrome c [Chitinophaga skermanii]RAJ05154.1 cbb3-type cytochrome c oxidase subunit III [Chitinophaga skermanii]